jgi:glycosyltransferase involved in cell wall biosynthesis
MKISLIIPAYNEEHYIGECLRAAIKNSGNKFHEIIVIDNASTDATPKIASQFPGVKIISEPEKGLTKARERGRNVASGDILAYIDADTRMPPHWLEQIEDQFSKNENLVILSGPYTYYDASHVRNFFVKLWYIFALPIYWLTGYMITGGNFAIRKNILEKMGGFDTSISFYGEDTNVARRAHQFGKVKFYLPFVMPTSARRFNNQGFLVTAFLYAANFFSEVIRHKPYTKDYSDFR